MQVFLKSVMSVLERAFESNQDDVMSILKDLQVRMCFDDGFGGGGDTNFHVFCRTWNSRARGFPYFLFDFAKNAGGAFPTGHDQGCHIVMGVALDDVAHEAGIVLQR